MKSPLIITGFPRSGTTLVRAIVGAHPRIRLVNESELLPAALSAGVVPGAAVSPEDRERVLGALLSYPLARRHVAGLPSAVLEQFRSDESDFDICALYEQLLPRPADADIWGEKSLAALSWVEEVLELYPESFVLGIVRDPRSVVRSKLVKDNARRDGRTTADRDVEALDPRVEWSRCARLAMSWQDAADILVGLTRELPAERFRVVRFEDVVAQPEEFADGICASLGIEPDPLMLDSASRANDPVLSDRGAFAHRRVGQDIDPSRATAWANTHPVLLWIVERFAATGMESFGYAPSHPRRRIIDRLRYGARLLKNRRRLHRARVEDRRNRFPGWEFAR